MSEKEFPHIPGYKIEKILGRGGMGIVYLAVQSALDRKVALKVTLAALAELDPAFTKRFVQEARATAALKHPNIITVFDAGVYENSSYMAMEYVPTGTLVDLEKANLSQEEICKLFIGISRGLGSAHKAGFVHRDIKPDNILIDARGNPLVTDFGIVKALDTKTALTRTGGTIGTPQYMSPEQIKAEILDGRSDLYSLGIMLFNLLEGHVPFADETPSAVYIKHVTTKPPLLSEKNQAFQTLITRLLRKDPNNRYKDADELIKALYAVLNKDTNNPLIKQKEEEKAKKLDRVDKTQLSQGLIKQITSEDTLVIFPDKPHTLKIVAAVTLLLLVTAGYFTYSKYFNKDDVLDDKIVSNQISTEPNMDIKSSQESNPDSNSNQELVEQEIDKEIEEQNLSANEDFSNKPITTEAVDDLSEQQNQTDTEVVQEQTDDVGNKPELINITLDLPQGTNNPIDEEISADQQQINQLLIIAQEDLNQWKLLLPEEDSAYAKFIKVLSLDKENITAQKGLLEIISKYDILSKQRLSENKFSQGLDMLNTAIKLREEYLNMGYDSNELYGLPNSILLANLNASKQQIDKLEQSFKTANIQNKNNTVTQTNTDRALEKGILAYKEKNYDESFKWLLQAATDKSATAEFLLGDLYYSGKGVKQSDAKALEWYERSANQNYTRAQLALATMYQQGSGVTQNESKAVQWYQKAAAQNNPKAQYNLGLIDYSLGKKDPNKYTDALMWFKKAAKLNDPRAQNKLGLMNKLGRGIPQNYDKAVEWYLKAAKQNLPEAQDNLGLMYFKGFGVTRDFEKSVEWYQKAANQNYADSQGVLGALYEYGRGVRKDSSTAVMWYKLAAKQGNEFAIKKLKKRGITKY